MRRLFALLAATLMLIVLAQFYFSASGVFGSYRPHHVLGYVIFSLPVVMAIVAGLGRLGARPVWLSLLVAGLTSVQVLVASLARGLGGPAGEYVFGLHAVGGLAILAVAWLILREARKRRKVAQGGPAPE
ncbi:DUF6220 domain-containing protein [Phytomonospora sp. NPDC050363]|uniref:DUF6220 domain-containing protein n=1 Tax=Phytomonospora sp. NPDC050363 TaxID=3155642 RepID=UPI0033D2E2CD